MPGGTEIWINGKTDLRRDGSAEIRREVSNSKLIFLHKFFVESII